MLSFVFRTSCLVIRLTLQVEAIGIAKRCSYIKKMDREAGPTSIGFTTIVQGLFARRRKPSEDDLASQPIKTEKVAEFSNTESDHITPSGLIKGSLNQLSLLLLKS